MRRSSKLRSHVSAWSVPSLLVDSPERQSGPWTSESGPLNAIWGEAIDALLAVFYMFSDALPIRVVFAEDNYLVREGVVRLLDLVDDVDLVSVCEDASSLRAAIEETSPDVVVTDIRMPPTGGDEGIRVADELRDTRPDVGVVVLSQFLEPQYALALFERGAAGRAYVLKERVRDLGQLVGAIREVAQGGSIVDVKVVETLIAARSRSDASPLADLTPRERETLEEMAQGKSNAAIARALVITEHSVEKVIHSIFLKLGLTWQPDINRRVKAVLLYLSEEGIPPDSAGAPSASTR